MSNPKHEWHFTVLLHVVYVMVFVAWLFMEQHVGAVWGVTGLASGVLIGFGVRAHRHGYFLSGAERFMHACVLADIVAEAWFIAQPSMERKHPGASFLLCALGFAVVIGGYRYLRQTRIGDEAR